MSFLGNIGTVIHRVYDIEQRVGPIVAAVYPPAAPAVGTFNSVAGAIFRAEAQHPTDGDGAVRNQIAVADFESGLNVANMLLQARGEVAIYDPAALQEAIAASVAAANAAKKLADSMTIKKIAVSQTGS